MDAANCKLDAAGQKDFNGGMAAAGDWMLEIFIGGLLLIPTFFLALVIRKREAIYTAFSRVLFGFSLTAPISRPRCQSRDVVVIVLARALPKTVGAEKHRPRVLLELLDHLRARE